MLDYVKEAKDVSAANIRNSAAIVKPLMDEVDKDTIENIWIVACGSSYNGCSCARAFMKKCYDHEIKIIPAYSFTNYEHDVKENDLVVMVSQSGYSTNIIDALQKVKTLNKKAIVLTGNPSSDIKEYADVVIEYGVGEELVSYVTKGVTTLALFWMLFIMELTERFDYKECLEKAVGLQTQMQEKASAFIAKHYKSFTAMHQCYLIGSSGSCGVCLEGALKMGETIHIPTNVFETEEYIHGPNLQLTPTYTVLLFDNNDHTSERTYQIYKATREVTDHAFLITGTSHDASDDHILQLDDSVCEECLSLVYLPFVQMLSFYVSKDLKTIDNSHPLMKKFKAIAKSKTDSYIDHD